MLQRQSGNVMVLHRPTVYDCHTGTPFDPCARHLRPAIEKFEIRNVGAPTRFEKNSTLPFGMVNGVVQFKPGSDSSIRCPWYSSDDLDFHCVRTAPARFRYLGIIVRPIRRLRFAFRYYCHRNVLHRLFIQNRNILSVTIYRHWEVKLN
jgi:hypothetical protein